MVKQVKDRVSVSTRSFLLMSIEQQLPCGEAAAYVETVPNAASGHAGTT